MPSSSTDHRPDAPRVPDEPELAHEVVPGPFGPGQAEAGGPYEWLTPQRNRPEPLRRDLPPDRAAS